MRAPSRGRRGRCRVSAPVLRPVLSSDGAAVGLFPTRGRTARGGRDWALGRAAVLEKARGPGHVPCARARCSPQSPGFPCLYPPRTHGLRRQPRSRVSLYEALQRVPGTRTGPEHPAQQGCGAGELQCSPTHSRGSPFPEGALDLPSKPPINSRHLCIPFQS